MHYIFEAGIVGIYSVIVYKILSQFLFELIPLLFAVGFVKHFLGFELSIHKIYCEYGNACSHLSNKYKGRSASNIKTIAEESIIEGTAFVVMGYLLSLVSKDRLLIIFIVGFLLHVIAELSGAHKKFCERCVREEKKFHINALLFEERPLN
jgi:hypothetical protein